MKEVQEVLSVYDPPGTYARVAQMVTYWEFTMAPAWTGKRTYWMTTLEDGGGHLWVQFHTGVELVRDTLRNNHIRGGSLAMPWAIFERVARDVLDAQGGVTKYLRREGSGLVGVGRWGRMVKSGRNITYITECGEHYILTVAELKALIS